MSKIKNGGLD